MTKMVNFTSAEAAPEHVREYARKVEALARQVLEMLNTCGETDSSVMLDVLLNVYINVGISCGRDLECADRMVQIGGQMLLRDALQRKVATGSAPAGDAPIVH